MISWLRRLSGKGSSPESKAASHRLSAEEEQLFDSPALEKVLAHLRSVGDARILDLGPASRANLELLSEVSSRLWFADIHDTLAASRRAPGGAGLGDALQYPAETEFDLVLAWDLPSYLEPELLGTLMGRILPHCRPGAWLYAVLSYLPAIPEEPLRFRILPPGQLAYQVTTPRTRAPASGLTPRDMGRHLPGFALHTSYLLRNGYQEYIFVRQ